MKGDKHLSIATEFKDFVSRGNAIDIAPGVIIGVAFSKIVDLMLKQHLMPLLGKALGGLDFTTLFVTLSSPPIQSKAQFTRDALVKAVLLRFAYGSFMTVALHFLILAPITFRLPRQINRMQAAVPPAPPPPTRQDVVLLREIRDALQKSSGARARMRASIGPILPAASRTTPWLARLPTPARRRPSPRCDPPNHDCNPFSKRQ